MSAPISRQPAALRQSRCRPSGLAIIAAIYVVALIDLVFVEHAVTFVS
jgi:hypothetical protein